MKYLLILLAIVCLQCKKKPTTGTVIFYTNTAAHGQIVVTVDGINMGTITAVYSGVPACNSAGCITVTLNQGAHSVTAQSNIQAWQGTLTVKPGECNSYFFN